MKAPNIQSDLGSAGEDQKHKGTVLISVAVRGKRVQGCHFVKSHKARHIASFCTGGTVYKYGCFFSSESSFPQAEKEAIKLCVRKREKDNKAE